MRFRIRRFVKIVNFKTNLAQFSGKGFGCQHAGVYSRTVTVALNVTDCEERTAVVLWFGVETK
jgi:hypothetical protein